MKKIAILTASMGLGTYIPALSLKDELTFFNINSDIFLYEDYISEDKRNNLKKYKKAFHNDIRLAIAGHQLMGKLNKSSNTLEIAKKLYPLINAYDEIIVLSGNWIDILCVLEEEFHMAIAITIIHLDCDKAPSWQNKHKYPESIKNEIWLLGQTDKDAKYYLSKKDSLEFNKRDNRLLLYGGGWGMGNYLEYADELSQHILLDVILHSPIDKINCENKNLYLFPEEWNPWQRKENNELYIPDLRICKQINKKLLVTDKTIKNIFASQDRALVSKPGGGTIIDALTYCTPLIFLDPISRHEQENASYYIKRGLAISIDEWRKLNYSNSVLEKISENINNYISSLKPLSEIFV